MVLGSGAEPASTEAEQAIAQRTGGTAVEAPVTARVSVNTSSSDAKVNRPGAVRNPFRQQHQPKPATAAGDAAPGAPGSANRRATETKTDAGKTGSGGTRPGPTRARSCRCRTSRPRPPATRQAPTAAQRRVYRVTIRFGESGAIKTLRDLARLKALPSFNKPLVMFMGVLSDGKTAAFLLAPGVQATGAGLVPSDARRTASTLEMRAGDDEALEARSGTGGIVQYKLKVLRVERKVLQVGREGRGQARAVLQGRP